MEALFDAGGSVLTKENYPLRRVSFVGTKGVAHLFCLPESVDSLVKVLDRVSSVGLPYVVFGLSSNILWGDGYFRGVVIGTRRLSGISLEDGFVVCEAGVRLSALVRFCVDSGLSGVEELWGIPGTVGAAAIMNAGAFGREFGELVEAVECWVDGEVVFLRKRELDFKYRGSNLRDKVVLKVWLKLAEGKIDTDRLSKLARKRREKFPAGRTLGSVFKNPFPFYAGRLIEEVGLKGYSMGRVGVSSKHANFIVSASGASAAEYVALVSHVKRRVLKEKGVLLREEIVYAGSFL